MKNIFKTLAAFAVIALAVACSKDGAESPALQEKATISFDVQLPGGLASRATNDGMTAKDLYYGVYNADRSELYFQGETSIAGGSTTVSLELVADQTYDLVFWAQATNAPYSINWATKAIVMDYTAAAGSDETRDAFIGEVDNITISGAMNKSVTLKRPFAQLNIGLSKEQIAKAANAGFTLESVQVTAQTHNTFSFAEGVGVPTGELQTIAFEAADYTIPVNAEGKHEIGVEGTTYDWVSFNYLLACTPSELTDVAVVFLGQGGKTIALPAFSNVPVERNHRTNIVGDLLTDPANFNVTIDPDFDDEDHNVIAPTYVAVTNAQEFNEAVADEDVEQIILEDDIVLTGSVTRAEADPSVTISAGKKLTINLNGKTLSANSTQTGKNYDMFNVRGTLTIHNGTVKAAHTGTNMGWNNSTNVFNITAGGVLNIENATVVNEGGSDMAFVAHLNNWGEVTLNVEKSTLESPYVAVRVFNSGNDMNNATIKNSTLKGGNNCFWVHNYTVADFGTEAKAEAHKKLLNFDIFNGTNTFEYTGKGAVRYGFTDSIYLNEYGCEIVAEGVGKDAEGNFCISNAAGLKWLAAEVNAKNTFAGKTVKLAADIDLQSEQWMPIGYWETFDGTFDGQSHTISNLKHISKELDCYIGLFGCTNNATIKNLTINNVEINLTAGDNTWAGGHIGALVGYPDGATVIENINVTGLVKIEGDPAQLGAQRIGGVIGGFSCKSVSLSNVTVEAAAGSYVKGNLYIGGIAGAPLGVVTMNNVKSNIEVISQDGIVGGIIGYAQQGSSFANCSASGNVTRVNANGSTNQYLRIGGIVGTWDCTAGTVTLNNCAYTGKAATFTNHGLVGGKYFEENAGSGKLVIDNVVYEDDLYTANSTESLKYLLENVGGQIELSNDIALTKTMALSKADFTLDGKGYTIRQAEGCTNTYALFDITGGKAALKNIVFDGIKEGAVVRTVNVAFTADNVTAQNGQHTQQQGLFRLMGKSTISNSTFKNNRCNMVISLNYDGANNDPQLVENCVFENNTCNATAVLYYVKGAGATINGNKFVGNTVNCSGNGATLYMGFTEGNTITNNLFKNNTVNEAGTSKRAAGGIMLGYETKVTGNAFVGNKVTGTNAKGNDVCASIYYTSIDLSGNYWGGGAPVENDDYFVEYPDSGNQVIINDYLTTNPIQ